MSQVDQSARAVGVTATPIAIHPDNPKYFLFRGKPLVLVAATEHYGSVVNRRFDFARYLAEAADKKQTMTRTFLLFRELQSARNPSSPIKPESPDYIAPWPRPGPGLALDGEAWLERVGWRRIRNSGLSTLPGWRGLSPGSDHREGQPHF